MTYDWLGEDSPYCMLISFLNLLHYPSSRKSMNVLFSMQLGLARVSYHLIPPSMSTNAVRPAVRAIQHATKAAGRTQNNTAKLSDEKMRSLISLYHQSETFITPENLSDRIDQVFTSNVGTAVQVTRKGLPTLSVFREIRARQVQNPRMGDWEVESDGKLVGEYRAWSSMVSRREKKVIEALYGVDQSAVIGSNSQNRSVRIMPGLEVLKEQSELENEGEQEKPL
jgi:hypothetical protein